jgi:hypothetical protein
VRRLRLIWAYRRSARPYIFLGVLCLLAGVGGLLDQEALGQSTIARELGAWAQKVWLGCYALGGLLLLAGTMWPRRAREDIETAGLCMVLGGMAINGMVVLTLRGPVVGGTTLLSILFASWMKVAGVARVGYVRAMGSPAVAAPLVWPRAPRMTGHLLKRALALVGLTGAATVSLDLATVVVALGALATAVVSAYKVRQSQPTVEADLEDRAVTRLRAALDTYVQDNQRLREQVEDLERIETELRVEVRACKMRIEHLTGVIQRAGLNGT